jgi:hypothetical protein
MAFGALAVCVFEAEALFMDATLPVRYLMGLARAALAVFEGVIDSRITKLREAWERGYRIPRAFLSILYPVRTICAKCSSGG